MEVQEARSLQDLNLVDRFLFDETMEVPELKLQDGAVRIFINTKGTNREEFSREYHISV